jgi:hypothetical protein
VAACGGTASSPTAAPGGNTNSGATGGDDPTAPVKGFYEAAFSGGDVASFICSAVSAEVAEAMKTSFSSMAQSMTGATFDLSGLTYTAGEISGDKTTVKIGGKIVADISGVKQDLPMGDANIEVPVVKENGVWKVCA